MPWDTVVTHTDPDTNVTVEKQHRRRRNRSNETRYLVTVTEERFIYLSRTQLFDMTDALDEVCDAIQDGEFDEQWLGSTGQDDQVQAEHNA